MSRQSGAYTSYLQSTGSKQSILVTMLGGHVSAYTSVIPRWNVMRHDRASQEA